MLSVSIYYHVNCWEYPHCCLGDCSAALCSFCSLQTICSEWLCVSHCNRGCVIHCFSPFSLCLSVCLSLSLSLFVSLIQKAIQFSNALTHGLKEERSYLWYSVWDIWRRVLFVGANLFISVTTRSVVLVSHSILKVNNANIAVDRLSKYDSKCL